MLVYPSGFDVSSAALRFLANRPRQGHPGHQRPMAMPTRVPASQALLALVHLRNGHNYAQLAAGFGVGTAYHHIAEAVEGLAAVARRLPRRPGRRR